MKSVHYSKIKGYSKLFTDYIEDYKRIEEFFNGDPSDGDAWLQQFSRCESKEYSRDHLIEILLRQNGIFGNQRMITRQIQKLNDSKSAVVITGQQAGLFWGPLYTIYKALTAVRFAQCLEQKYNRPVLPIFWMEVDDHDFEEVRHFYEMMPNGAIKRFEYSDGEDEKSIPVMFRYVTPALSSLLEELDTHFGSSEFAKKTLTRIKKIYKPGKSFVEVFIRFFREYFPKEPLIFFNPGESDAKRAAQSFYRRILAQHDAIHEQIVLQTEALIRKQYVPQVELRSDILHVFQVVNKIRSRLDSRTVFHDAAKTSEGLDAAASAFVEHEVESLSPDVLFRPLLQDSLFPTVAYVGGSSEISYFAQLKKAYNLLDIPMPVMIPRWSGTIIDKKTAKFLGKINFDPSRIIEGNTQELLPQIMEMVSGKRIDSQFESAYKQLQTRLDEIRKLGATLDSTLVKMVDNSEQKMKYQLDKIEGRFQHALQTANKIATERASRSISAVLPDDRLQERTFSLLHFILRYGTDFAKYLPKKVTIETRKHHVLKY